jgi:NADPH-dependent 2,4-dienoyl-CoA reductase/sulfur reductase-like enzyme/nitrite reductase/ring-hydroxylating ferredoxin subunit
MTHKEVTVATTGEFNDGEMKQVSADGTDILLARVEGKYHAVGALCTHYGAPLVEGVLSGGRIVCPWHHACFNVATGDLEEPPALDALPCYEVRAEGENVIVSLPVERTDRRTPAMTGRDTSADGRLFIILGGGAAGYAAAQTLREDGFRGRVCLITREDRAPYDRPNLSKDYLSGHAEAGWMPLRADEFYEAYDIELVCKKEVTRVDARAKTITFEGGETQGYDALLVATGGVPRRLNIPGGDLKNVHLLRSFADADSIIESAKTSSRAVVAGASFIGMEAAAALAGRGLEVTVIAPSAEPFQSTLGPEIGAVFRRLHEEHGVKFKLGSMIYRVEGTGKAEAVVLEGGERIETDMVLVGVGVHPATGFLDGVTLHEDGGVIVDEHLRAAEGLYAAGDIAHYPDARTGERTRIEHWRTAQQQGRVVAHNMAGRATKFDAVPFFWTQQFDAGLLYVGHAARWDEIVYRGDVAGRDFIAFYVTGGRVSAAAGMSHDREMAIMEELLRLDRAPAPARLGGAALDLPSLLDAALREESPVRDGAYAT